MSTRSNRSLHLSLLLALAASVALPTLARAAVQHDDEWITAMVKMEMWTTAGVPSREVYVDTVDGRVVLSGKVETDAERDAADKVAHTIEGVTDVRNLVQVVPKREEKAVARADKEVQEAIGKAFASDRALRGTQIKSSVNNGGVLLTGEARTFSEHLVAIETARMVKGVTSVATQVKSPRDLTDDEIADGRAIRAGRDVFITTAVKLRLIADRAVPTADVKVDSRYGMVVLFGTVPTDTAKAAAGRDAGKVKGVDRVLNDLQVVPSADSKLVAAKDEVVKESVEKALAARDELHQVNVSVKNAVVRLTGSVHSVPSKLRAAVMARATAGVDSVENDLRIRHNS